MSWQPFAIADREIPGIECLDGVMWCDAPVPRRSHTCTAQMRATLSSGEYVERCACGAIAFPREFPGWSDRNSRTSPHIPWWRRWRR